MFCHIRFKACRKCGGDISLEDDHYGRYFVCIQCGAEWNVSDMTRRNLALAPLNNIQFIDKQAVLT